MQLSQQWDSWNDVQTSNPALSLEGTPKESWGLLEPGYPGDLQQGSWSKGPDSQMGYLLSPQNPHMFSQSAEPRGKASMPTGLSRGVLFATP